MPRRLRQTTWFGAGPSRELDSTSLLIRCFSESPLPWVPQQVLWRPVSLGLSKRPKTGGAASTTFATLPQRDEKSRKVLEAMRADESRHGAQALADEDRNFQVGQACHGGL